MTIAHLLDHRCTVFRQVVTKGNLGEEVRTLTQVATTVRCGVRRPSARLGKTGPGIAPIGERVLYFTPEVDVVERDVVRLDTGPDAGGAFEVDAPPTRPRGHHLEVTARHYVGVVP